MEKNNIFKSIFKKDGIEEPPLQLYAIIKKVEDEIEPYEKNMILNIIRYMDATVKEIIVPRVDVVSVPLNAQIDEIIKLLDDNGISRLPVYDGTPDNVVGILHVKDILKYFRKKEDFELSSIIRPPLFVPESKKINDLLVELREKKTHLAIVVDEYGGMSGLLALEDIIEKIVGNIQDEFDKESEPIVKIGENTYMVNPRINIWELNDEIGTDINEEDIDTLGGLIFMLSGNIPKKNDKIKYKNYLFTVENIDDRKLKKIKIEILNSD